MKQCITQLALLIIGIVMIVPISVVAANYSVAPLIIDLDLQKRDIVTKTITLTNNEGRMLRIYPTVNEITVDDGGTLQEFVEPSMIEDKASSITSWLQIGRGRIELAPGESTQIDLTIQLHPEASAGEYHAMVSFPDGSNRPTAEAKVQTGQLPSTIVRIGIEQEQNQFLRLVRFTVERFIKATTEGDIAYVLHNPGATPVVPTGEVIIYDTSGSEVAAIELNEEGTAIEPDAESSFISKVPEGLKMGKYKAFLSVEYGEHQKASVHDTAFFYVLPIKMILIIFGVVLTLSIIVALYVHKRYDLDEDDTENLGDSVAMYLREGVSEGKDHDIDLKKKNE